MKAGLVIAMEEEMKGFPESGGEITAAREGCRTLYSTRMNGCDVVAVLSGYGQIDAAAAAQILLTRERCDVVLNFGVAGALDPSLRVDDLFLVNRVCHYDFDISPVTPVKEHQYAEFPDEFIPLDAGLIRLALEKNPALRPAAAASGDRFVENREEKLRLAALGCQICDMEIAAVARVCALNGVPCLSLKCISDTLDGDGSDFLRNVENSARKGFETFRKVLEALREREAEAGKGPKKTVV